VDSDGEIPRSGTTKNVNHDPMKNISFQSVEVETFEYADNKYIDEDISSNNSLDNPRIRTV